MKLLEFFGVWKCLFLGKMTAGQEGKDITEFLIHTVNLPKFSESETLFFPFPSCPAVILP